MNERLENPAGEPALEAATLPTMDDEAFKAVMRNVGSSVAVITVSHRGRSHGMTATAVCSVSTSPPKILIVVNRSTRSHPVIADAKRFTINILADHQAELGKRFSEKHLSPFDGVAHRRGEYGGPVLHDCAAYVECHTATEFEVGTHTIFVGDVVHGRATRSSPLLYHDRQYKSLLGGAAVHDIASHATNSPAGK
jgi:flavin reductase (DIM6/NTAB) family NADH-FMN oxidoreductase RutF